MMRDTDGARGLDAKFLSVEAAVIAYMTDAAACPVAEPINKVRAVLRELAEEENQ